MALFYLHRRHGWLTPASVYSWSAQRVLLAHIRTAVLFYLHRRHGWLTPASVYSWSAQRVLLAHIRTAVLFYLHRRHGWLTPASVYSQSALACYLLISGHSSKRKPAVHTSVTTGFFFPHCLRLHHAHSGAGTGWHCWSVLFDCSYC